jgi:hypothetical protein
MHKFLLLLFFALTSTLSFGQSLCKMETFKANLATPNAVVPTKENFGIAESTDPTKFLSIEKRVLCTESDLLNLGFQIRAMNRYGPSESSNGRFETQTLYQLGKFAVNCYYEYELDKPGKTSQVIWSRAACQQIASNRVFKIQ